MTMNKEAILTAIQAVPKRPYQLIAQEFGVSVASVSGVATEAGIKRGRGGAGTSASPRGRRSEASEQIAGMRLEAVPMAEIMAQTGFTRQGVDAACLSFLRRQVQVQAQEHGLSVASHGSGLIVNGHEVTFCAARMDLTIAGVHVSIQDVDTFVRLLKRPA